MTLQRITAGVTAGYGNLLLFPLIQMPRGDLFTKAVKLATETD